MIFWRIKPKIAKILVDLFVKAVRKYEIDDTLI